MLDNEQDKQNARGPSRTWTGGPARCVHGVAAYRECTKCGDVATGGVPVGVQIALGVIGVLLVIAVFGCSSPIASDALVGEFRLERADGATLPVAWPAEDIDSLIVSWGWLSMYGDGTYEQTLRIGRKDGNHTETNVSVVDGWFTDVDRSGRFMVGESPARVVDGNTVSVSVGWIGGATVAFEFERLQ